MDGAESSKAYDSCGKEKFMTLNATQILEQVQPLLANKRFALTIVADEQDENGEFIPCVAIEGEKGYRPLRGNGPCATPWHWGKDYNKAMALCDDYNEKLGLTRVEAWKIVGSTMRN
jgi:hypothetical protein